MCQARVVCERPLAMDPTNNSDADEILFAIQASSNVEELSLQ